VVRFVLPSMLEGGGNGQKVRRREEGKVRPVGGDRGPEGPREVGGRVGRADRIANIGQTRLSDGPTLARRRRWSGVAEGGKEERGRGYARFLSLG
jgi:hypothetical protein